MKVFNSIILTPRPARREGASGLLEGVRERFSGATEPLDEAVLVRWKQLLADLKAKNRTIACEDSLIAATALLRGHTVLTGNKLHFEPTGARVEDPTR